MSYASAVVFSPPQPDVRRALRTTCYIMIGCLQALGFAAGLYVLVAGAGLLSDPASTGPLQVEPAR